MPGQVTSQYSFNLGQVNAAFSRRVNEDFYWKAAIKMENVFVTSQGTVRKRNGTVIKTDVTSLAEGGTPDLFTEYIYSPSNSLVRAVFLRVGTSLSIAIESLTLSFQTLELPYTDQQASEVNFIPVRGSIIMVHPKVQPYRIVFDGDTFTISEFTFTAQATFDFQKVEYFPYDVVIVGGTAPGSEAVITIGGIKFPSPDDWVGGIIIGPGENINAPFGFGTIRAATIVDNATQFTVLTKTTYGTSTTYLGRDFSIQQPIFTEKLGYPANGGYFQNRVWFIGHPEVPTTVFGTALGTQNNLDVGVGNPTDAIVYTSNIPNSGNFINMTVGRHLEIFSENNEMAVPMSSDVGLGPQNFYIAPQTTFKASKICKPVAFQNYTFFAGADGSSIYSFKQDMEGDEDSFVAKNESIYCSDLINFPLKLVPFIGDSGSTVMLAVLNSNDTIAVFQMSEPMEIAAWTEFTVPRGTSLVSIDTDGTNLLMLKHFTATNKYSLETLFLDSNCFIDSSVPVTIESGQTVVTGIGMLDGFDVYVANDTEELGQYTVVNGELTLSKPAASQFVGYVGLFYPSILKPMDPNQIAGYNYAYSIVDKIYVDYENSLAVTVNDSTIPYQYFDKMGEPLELQSGTYEYFPEEGWGRFPQIMIEQSNPVPMEITGIAYSITTSGR